jgi:hypothetical protein
MDDSPNDTARQVAPQRDEPRQTPPLDPAHFTMTVDGASARFAEAGLPRSLRTIQRYCQRGHLTCTTVDTEIAEMYLIDPESVERRIQELQQIEFVTRTTGLSRQDAPSRDMSRHDATVRDTPRQEVAPEKIEAYERRIKELEEKAMHLEIDKRAREQIINMLKEDRETLFVQVSNHVRTITDQARVIGQLETRLELGPGRIVEEQPRPAERPPVQEPGQPPLTYRPSEPVHAAYEPPSRFVEPPEPAQRYEEPIVEYPPRYGVYSPPGRGDNPAPARPPQGVQ